ncbi:MAG: Flp family type IVb pilin [Geminicoccaceae bacterium]|nr:Flp family type IVb pilin [Geminicoccaceae bacterium]MCB9942123.1 Flp family type IVb pilin [Geminicoccaceae bacterium]
MFAAKFRMGHALFDALLSDERGSNSIEYGLLGSLLAVICIIILTQVSDQIVISWQKIGDTLSVANTP